MKVEHKGRIIQGTNESEVWIQLREEQRLTYQKIADMFEVSRQYVWEIIHKKVSPGLIDYPELEDPATFDGKSDDQIASELDVVVYRVKTARQKLFPGRRKKKVDIITRRKLLCRRLFGDEYDPGVRFINVISDFVSLLSERQTELIMEFYIKGADESLAANINSDSRRVYRKTAVDKLDEKLFQTYSIEQFIKMGVICHKV